MSEHPNVCIDQTLSEEQLELATQKSIELNPANQPESTPFEIAVAPMWLWPPGHRIKIRFLDGNPVVQERVIEFAKEWEKHANLHFDFGDHKDAEIRISFAIEGQSWSKLGTQALGVTDQSEPTMNFGWLKPDSKDETYSSVVLHEFGHALGCIHEHQHPDNKIPWDEDAVYKYYTGPPNEWSPVKTKMNVLLAYPKGQTQFSEFDKNSIMLYPIPNAHTKGDWFVDWRNNELSDTDKAFIAKQYPPTADDDDEPDRPQPGQRITGGEQGVSGANPLEATPPGSPDLPPDVRTDRNEVANSIRSEVLNLQTVLASIQAGESSLSDQAPYIKKTAEDIQPDVTKLVELDKSDQARNIENQWEQMSFNPLLQNLNGPFDPQQQANHLNQLNGNAQKIVTMVGNMTIPDRINEWLEQSRLGYYFSFNEVFEDELPDQADRDRLLKHLKWAPNALTNGLVDQSNGLIYRTTSDKGEQRKSRLQLLVTIIATFVAVTLLVVPTLFDEAWPLSMNMLPSLLLGWVAVQIGMIIHVMVSGYKRSRDTGGRPPIVALGDLPLWLSAKSGQIVFRLGLALFALCGLAFGTGGVSILNAFLVGYSLDSFLEIFSGALDSESSNLTSQFSGQAGG